MSSQKFCIGFRQRIYSITRPASLSTAVFVPFLISSRDILLCICLDRWLLGDWVRVRSNRQSCELDQSFRLQDILQAQAGIGDLLANLRQVDSFQVSWPLMGQSINGSSNSQCIVQDSFMCVKCSGWLKECASRLKLDVRYTDVSLVLDECRCTHAFLRLDDLVEDAVYRGGWDACRSTTAIAKCRDELAVVLLLQHCRRSWSFGEARRQSICQDGSMSVTADGDDIRGDVDSTWPVLVRPLISSANVTMRSGYLQQY